MRERVSVIHGKKPVILVCPHGSDDTNTAIITEVAAEHIDCYAVINRGFERSELVDVNKDKANCNRIDHCKEEVVYDEFFKPILKFKDKIYQKATKGTSWWNDIDPESHPIYIFHIHGCGNHVHKQAGEPVGVIVGYGLGSKKNSLTCTAWRKDCFIDMYRNSSQNGDAFEGAGGGNYAGRDANNMNQYFRKHDHDEFVQSMQLEFPFSERETPSQAAITGLTLATAILDLISYKDYTMKPKPKFI